MSDTETTTRLERQSIFIARKRIASKAALVIGDTTLTIIVRGDMVHSTWTILETAKAGQAWDVDRNGERVQFATQTDSCGCQKGIKRYTPDASYSGALRHP